MSADLALRQTLTALVTTYETEIANVKAAYATLAQAEKNLQTIGPYIRTTDYNSHPDQIIPGITKSCWYVILERLELRKVASIKRWQEITANVDNGKMPPLNMQTCLDLLQSAAQNVPELAKEACLEVYGLLTPGHRKHGQAYKRNSRGDIEKRVILSGYIENKWSRGFQVGYHRSQELIQIDRVFHALDGKALTTTTYSSPLVEAINSQDDGKGTTEYFDFTAHQNGNLHLTFRRLDLVAALNATAANGYSLKP